jgi:hypothetical protein
VLFDLSIQQVSVYPKVLQAVTPSLFSAELYLAVASPALAHAIHQVFESDLLHSSSVRKYGIPGNVVGKEFGKAELAVVVLF